MYQTYLALQHGGVYLVTIDTKFSEVTAPYQGVHIHRNVIIIFFDVLSPYKSTRTLLKMEIKCTAGLLVGGSLISTELLYSANILGRFDN